MMQKEITQAHNLLDAQGNLIEAGWLRRPLLTYNRDAIRHRPALIREWNYFWAGDEEYGIGVSIASMGSIHRLSLHYMEYKTGFQASDSAICKAADSILQPPLAPLQDVHFKNEQAEGRQIVSGNSVKMTIDFKRLAGKDFTLDLALTIPTGDHTVIVVPFDEDPGMFYYNHKVNCIKAAGSFTYGGATHSLNTQKAWGVMDWGRGVWPAKNVWYWGSGNGLVNGKPFGFNIGYGFGNTQSATENMVVYDGVMHKLEHVKFHIANDETAYMEPWRFTSSDGRFEMTMVPVLDRFSEMPPDAAYGSTQHQVFGMFSGTATLNDGTVLQVKDVFGFAEKVVNSWSEE